MKWIPSSAGAPRLAVAMGARVIVTSGSDEKLERARGLGASAGINYKQEDVLARVKQLNEGRRVDLSIDGTGIATLPISLQATAERGRVVRFGAVTGPGEISTGLLGVSLLRGGMASQSEFATRR